MTTADPLWLNEPLPLPPGVTAAERRRQLEAWWSLRPDAMRERDPEPDED